MDQTSKTITTLFDEMALFKIKRYAVLVDDSVNPDLVQPLTGDGFVGFFTFTFDVAGKFLLGHQIHPLDRPSALPECDGWILGTGSKARYALNLLLLQGGRENQVILSRVGERSAAIFSYVDFFKGETRTRAYVHNIFERAYKIHLPIALRYVLRSAEGEAVKASQRILPPGHTLVFDSDDFDVPTPFSGYLEFYADVRHLNGPVSSFLHLNCDYISDDAMTSVHQSGFAPWPAGSRFCRGLMPPEPDRRLTVSMYNRENDEPIQPKVELRCTLDGERRSVVRDLPPVPKGHMVFADVSEIFAPELARGATAADVIVIPNLRMHRPNFYHHRKDRMWSWQSVEHSAAPVERVMPSERRAVLRRAGLNPWVCPLPILPKEAGLDTVLFYFQDGPARLRDFRLRAYDAAGRCVLEKEAVVDFGTALNVNNWLKTAADLDECSMVTLVPSDRAPAVPEAYQAMGGFQSRRHPAPPATLLAGVVSANLPLEVERSSNWNHPMLSVSHTEVFGKARVGNGFDTTVVLYNVSPADQYDREARIEFDVLSRTGRLARFYKTIPPNASITLSIGDLLAGTDLRDEGEDYSLWAYCRDQHIYGYHIVRRERDDTLAIEHFYFPRFNAPDV